MSLRTRVITAAWILFWVLMTAVELEDYRHGGGTKYWQPVLWEASSALVATVLMLTQRRVMRRFDTFLSAPTRWFALQIAWLPLYWIIFIPTVFLIRHAVYAAVGDHYTHLDWVPLFVYEAIKLSLYYLILVVTLFGILTYDDLQREKERAALADLAFREMQLQRLTQQIQPHFLFNALNTISQLMHTDVQRADTMLVQLADVLRSTLAFGDTLQTTLGEELRWTRAYANLMCERFSGRVEIDWNIPVDTESCQVPIMTLQPLLENIFKHTVEQRRTSVRISVETRRVADRLVLALEDDTGTLQASEGKGIGVKNLRQRLQTLYGNHGNLLLTQLTPAGVRAEVTLPCAC